MGNSEDVRALLGALYDAYGTGDTSVWESHLAPDVLAVGTDETEWWQGRDVLLSAARAQLAEMRAAGMRVTGGDPVIADHGASIIVADRPSLHLPNGDVTTVRLTLTLSRTDETLAIEQMHMSVPAPNEAVLGQTLTT